MVGHLNGLDCGNTSDFVEILRIIDRDLSLGLSENNPIPMSKSIPPIEVVAIPDRKAKPFTFKEQPLSEQEQAFWKQYGITVDTLAHYKVCSLREYQSETAEGKPFCLVSSPAESIFGYKNKRFVKLYRPFSKVRFMYGGTLEIIIVSDWSNCQPKEIRYLLQVEKRM